MNKFLVPSTGVALVALVLAWPAAGQRGQRCCKGMPSYDTATQITVTGTVVSVVEPKDLTGRSGLHLELAVDEMTYDVHLGPAFYFIEREIAFTVGEEIEVTGSKVRYRHNEALVARLIRQGERTILLRDARGIPVWARRGGPTR